MSPIFSPFRNSWFKIFTTSQKTSKFSRDLSEDFKIFMTPRKTSTFSDHLSEDVADGGGGGGGVDIKWNGPIVIPNIARQDL